MLMPNRWRELLLTVLCVATLMIVVNVDAAKAANHKRQCRNGYVSLSFDDGPTDLTPALLAALSRERLRVTFFDVGERAEALPSLVQSQAAAGHSVANHSFSHPDLTLLGEQGAYDELARTQLTLAPLAGSTPDFYRPPYGAISSDVRAAAARLGLTEVIWTVDTNDWDGRSAASIVSTALSVKPGGFILMHDGYENTLAALPRIATGLARRGLCAGKIVRSDTPTIAWEGLDFPASVAAW